ncbi:MAG: PIG-L family deacetylase [Candidatus Nanopelagicales bacterium]
MAERLAPEQAPPRVTSRPERAQGHSRRWGRRLLGSAVLVAVLVAAAVATLHFLGIQRSAQEVRATALIPEGEPADVLVVLARPGQELPMAATLAELDQAGATVSVLALTAGEDQPPVLDFGTTEIAEVRGQELARAGEILGVDRVELAGYRAGELVSADPAEVTARIAEELEAVQPSVVLTVGDQTGSDTDSQSAAAYALAAAQAKDSGVARVWTVTRGDREISWNALARAPIGSRVPEPQVAVRVDSNSGPKEADLLAHGTQSPELARATYPYADRIPAWAYFRFWDREYFALAWGTPLQ